MRRRELKFPHPGPLPEGERRKTSNLGVNDSLYRKEKNVGFRDLRFPFFDERKPSNFAVSDLLSLWERVRVRGKS